MNNSSKNKLKSYTFKKKQTEPNYIPNKYHSHTKKNTRQETTNLRKHSIRLYPLNTYTFNQDGFVGWKRILQINLELFLVSLFIMMVWTK